MDHAEEMNRCDDKAVRVGLARLTPVERVVVLVSRVNFEVELGGLDTFYYNSAGDEAITTVAALEAVAATRSAAVLGEANALFPGGSPPRNREERFEGLVAVRELPGRPLAALERKFGRDDVFSLLCKYMDTHAEELQGGKAGRAKRRS